MAHIFLISPFIFNTFGPTFLKILPAWQACIHRLVKLKRKRTEMRM
jgi:hypothetical protein